MSKRQSHRSSSKSSATTARTAEAPPAVWQWALLLVVPLVVYGRTLSFDYVMHDDDKMIVANPAWEEGMSLTDAFTTDAWMMDARIELYRPWQTLTYMADHAIGGVAPWIYHLHNLLALLAGIFLLALYLRDFVPWRFAWGATLLYSVNLLVPHTAGWLAARGDLYLMIFGLLFLWLVNRALHTGSGRDRAASVLVFALALLAKESAVALLPVAGLQFWLRKRAFNLREGFWLGALLLVFGGYYALRAGAIADAGNLSAGAFLSNLRSLPESVLKMLIPVGFSVMPGYRLVWTIGGVLVMALAIVAVRRYRPSDRILWTGLAICLLPLLPSLAYEPSFAGVAYDYLDHRAWFPFAGLALIAAGAVERFQRRQSVNLMPVFITLLVAWSAVNMWRLGVYKDWQAYYANAMATNPSSGLALLNYGSLLRDAGRYEEAVTYMQQGVDLSPAYADAYVRLGELYFKLARYPEAIAATSRALELEPDNIPARQFRGSALGVSGRAAEAIADFSRVLELQPNDVNTLYNLGLAYKETGRYDLAVGLFTQLLRLAPNYPNAYFERGFCRGRQGLFRDARTDFDEALRRQPEHGPSFFFRGRTWEAMGDLSNACADWRRAAELGVEEAELYVRERCSNQ